MKFGSVCSGIEAASVAWHPLGWTAAWLSEIEPFPCAVLKHHYPDVPNHGDMTLLPEKILSGQVEAPDLFCGGTPCQAFSVAGLRNSLDDARGNLSLTFVGIANAIDHVRSIRGDAPAIVFWENVPGVLNTKDNAFGCFLGALAGESDPIKPPGGGESKWSNAGCVFGPQRTVAWRVLDAQYFGVAQRRRRVFVVASARDDINPIEILFESEGVRRDTAPSRKEGERIAPCVTNGPPFSRTGNERVEAEAEAMVIGALDTECGGTKMNHQTIASGHIFPVNKSAEATWWNGGQIASTITTRSADQDMPDKANFQAVLQPIPIHDQATRHAGKNGEKTMGKGNGLGIGQPGDPMNTLTKGDSHAVAIPIAFPSTLSGTQYASAENVAPSMGATNPTAVAYNIAPGKGELKDDIHVTDAHVSKTIDASGSNPAMHQGGAAIVQTMAVRRLTPVECERLQGFPDNYSNIPWRKAAESPDGPRYKALGNSWAVPVVAWLGQRIKDQLQ
jgi:DNA (cytosine-5)-methyltransferase 1